MGAARLLTGDTSTALFEIVDRFLRIKRIAHFLSATWAMLPEGAMLVITFFISLFEIHGSVIANVQLHEAGEVAVSLLCGPRHFCGVLLYSKLFLIATLGSASLQAKAFKSTAILFLTLAVSRLTAVSFV